MEQEYFGNDTARPAPVYGGQSARKSLLLLEPLNPEGLKRKDDQKEDQAHWPHSGFLPAGTKQVVQGARDENRDGMQSHQRRSPPREDNPV
ncbi:hypothetical protein AA14337_0633 [Acetobacter malorum DSM 14337]|uniref:Uncharacterized protein n=1 Tax=Acetobacter malorum DSM 14337 TaxID=1307910 RepID=A0ABQ0PRN6_9PROT|nr:hypothetical protein AA14337_0633 [Acetobacter malorum DSM 14337]